MRARPLRHKHPIRLPEPTLQVILKEFYESESCPENWPQDWVQHVRPAMRRNSVIYKLKSPSAGTEIIIKVITTANASTEAENIYNSMLRYHSTNDQFNSIPRPLGFISSRNAIIMDFLELPSLKRLLVIGMLNKSIWTRSIEKTAGWLRWFHSQSKLTPRLCTLEDRIKVIESRALKLRRAKLNLIGRYIGFEKLFTQAKNIALTIENHLVNYSKIHGDFKPSNILTDFETTVGIDFAPSRFGYITDDICRFLSHVDLHRFLFTKSMSLKMHKENSCFKKFLETYGESISDINQRFFIYLYLIIILDRLSVRTLFLLNNPYDISQLITAIRLKKIAENILSAEDLNMRT